VQHLSRDGDDDLILELYFHYLREMAENMLNYEWPVDSHGKKVPNQKMWVSYRSTTQSSSFWRI
jgi:hypothetical protein